MIDFSGKTVLVCGAANKKSVGFHVGKGLQEAGAEVVWTVHTEARRAELAGKLGGDVLVISWGRCRMGRFMLRFSCLDALGW